MPKIKHFMSLLYLPIEPNTKIAPAFEKEGALKVGQNKYDMLVLGNYGS